MKVWLAVAAVAVSAAGWGLLGSGAAGRGTPPATQIRSARWINSPPLTPESLRGKVVAVEFWTYG